MKLKTIAGLLILLCVAVQGHAQEDSLPKKKLKDYIQLSGYVKELQSFTFTSPDYILTDNLLHNRINLKGTVSPTLSASLEFRNRLFWGERIHQTPGYGKSLEVDKGLIDLSKTWVDKPAFVAHTMIDRAYLNWTKDKWNVRLGRQRINWGVNLVWNPNDLFNTYNFIDFDYEERPGSDAVRVQYFRKSLSSIELAIRPDDDIDKSVGALMYKFNKWNYDFQLLGGNFYTDLALGAGWAGNIKGAGFKGEATYFQPRDNMLDTSGALSASVSADYAFPNTVYLHGSMLYNSTGVSSLQGGQQLSLFSAFLSAKSLMPTKYSYFLQIGGNVSPLLRADLSTIYGAGLNVLFFMPSVNYSIREDWDLNLVGQLYYGEFAGDFGNLGNSIFLRLKWSY